MIRLQPDKMYKCLLRSCKTNESKTVKWNGARLDHFMKHPDFLVTVTSDEDQKVYPKHTAGDAEAATQVTSESK